jgi:hypothetical protein
MVVVLPTAVLVTLLCATYIVVVDIDTGLPYSAAPMATPLTLDPATAWWPSAMILTEELVALLCPTYMVVVLPIDTGLLGSA